MSTTTTSLPHIHRLAQYLNDAGLKASAWQNRRVYINGLGRDIKAYIELDEPLAPAPQGEPDAHGFHPLYSGCALRVFSNAAQNRAWLVNRAKQVKHELAEQLHAAGLIPAPCDDWRDIIL